MTARELTAVLVAAAFLALVGAALWLTRPAPPPVRRVAAAPAGTAAAVVPDECDPNEQVGQP